MLSEQVDGCHVRAARAARVVDDCRKMRAELVGARGSMNRRLSTIWARAERSRVVRDAAMMRARSTLVELRIMREELAASAARVRADVRVRGAMRVLELPNHAERSPAGIASHWPSSEWRAWVRASEFVGG